MYYYYLQPPDLRNQQRPVRQRYTSSVEPFYRYSINDLLYSRHVLPYLICPLERFSSDAFKYHIVTPHISASAYIDPHIRKKIANLLYTLDLETMQTANDASQTKIPPHMRAKLGMLGSPVQTPQKTFQAPLAHDSSVPLTVHYANIVGKEVDNLPAPIGRGKGKVHQAPIAKSGESFSEIDVDMATSWWSLLCDKDKIGVASEYILEGRELQSAKPESPKNALAVGGSTNPINQVSNKHHDTSDLMASKYAPKKSTQNHRLSSYEPTPAPAAPQSEVAQDEWETPASSSNNFAVKATQQPSQDPPSPGKADAWENATENQPMMSPMDAASSHITQTVSDGQGSNTKALQDLSIIEEANQTAQDVVTVPIPFTPGRFTGPQMIETLLTITPIVYDKIIDPTGCNRSYPSQARPRYTMIWAISQLGALIVAQVTGDCAKELFFEITLVSLGRWFS
ncbi:hypothetical protein DFH27DRAFT_554444 [Peziza echinospora]|nr:hypothetical protein DFH27DRAFT_554444 [Peziza echinospora]